LRVDGIPGGGDLRLLLANGRFSTGDFGLFSGQLVLVPPARGFDQRRRQRFRQLDLRSATGQVSVGSVMVYPGIRARIDDGTGCLGRKFALLRMIPRSPTALVGAQKAMHQPSRDKAPDVARNGACSAQALSAGVMTAGHR
jgi:hypothetical protein